MLLILALFAAAAWGQTADLVIENARIYTVNPVQPQAKAIAVKDGIILAVGDSVASHIGPGTQRIDVAGAAVIPGLIDSHVHMAALGDMLATFDLRDVKSIAEIASIVKREAAKRPNGEWVRGRAWDQTNWGGQFPTSAPLTAAAPDHPVYLTRVDGHAAWVNAKALALAGITAATPDPAGGKIVRDARGNPTGVLIDRAQALVGSRIPSPTPEQIQQRLRVAADTCVRLGLTTVHDAGIDSATMAAYHSLVARREMPLRIYAMIGGEGALWQEYLRRGPEIGDQLTVRCIKLVSDGAMGSRGAAFWQPYSDDPGNRGLLILSEADIERVARAAASHGFQVATHAIGDRANRTVLDAYAAALGGANEKRFRIEHAQIVSLPDFSLFKKYDVIASIESTHATSDMRWVEQRLGPDRIAGAYAWRRFLRMGIPLANGSDTPVENPNPLWGFYAAITRQDHNGQPPGGWTPDQRLTRDEALRSWTLGGAYAAFQEKVKGSLQPGKMADFVVLDRDIMTAEPRDILTTKVRMTFVGGRKVYGQ